MDYIRTLTTAEQAVMQAKADAGKTTIKTLLDFKVQEYLDACARDVGADDLAKVLKEIADPDKMDAVKTVLGL